MPGQVRDPVKVGWHLSGMNYPVMEYKIFFEDYGEATKTLKKITENHSTIIRVPITCTVKVKNPVIRKTRYDLAKEAV